MDSIQREQLVVLFEAFDVTTKYSADQFVRVTQHMLDDLERIETIKWPKASEVNQELEKVRNVLDSLSPVARMHITQVTVQVLKTDRDPLSGLRSAVEVKYKKPKSGVSRNTLTLADGAHDILIDIGVRPSPTSIKTGHFVQYLTIIKRITGKSFDPYNLARKYFLPKRS